MDVAEQTSEMPQPTNVASSPHPPSAEEPRYPRRERHKPARFKDYEIYSFDINIIYQTKEELPNFTVSIEADLAVLFFRESIESLDFGRTLRSMSNKR